MEMVPLSPGQPAGASGGTASEQETVFDSDEHCHRWQEEVDSVVGRDNHNISYQPFMKLWDCYTCHQGAVSDDDEEPVEVVVGEDPEDIELRDILRRQCPPEEGEEEEEPEPEELPCPGAEMRVRLIIFIRL